MKFELPDIDELKDLAAGLNLPLDERKAQVLLEYLQPFATGYEYIDRRGGRTAGLTLGRTGVSLPAAG